MLARLKRTTPNDYSNSLKQFCCAVMLGDNEVASYSNNYQAVHTSALNNTFATTRTLLPTQVFTALAQVYAKHYQPNQWDINLYGDQFSEFLKAQNQSAKSSQYDWLLIANMAAIEYAISVVYYAADNAFNSIEPHKIEPADMTTVDVYAHDTGIGRLLQQQHPYCLVNHQLLLSNDILLWREAHLIRIENS